MRTLEDFRQIWLVDFEFTQPDGARPTPLCVVAHELRQGVTIRRWLEGQTHAMAPPYVCDRQSLFVAYYASAELLCHLVLGWPLPPLVMDLYAEFRNLTNGRVLPVGNSLLGALSVCNLDMMDAAEKADMRALAMRGGPYDEDERRALLDYCTSDTKALQHLLPVLAPHVHLEHALLRGRYMRAAARMEYAGIPIDTETLATVREVWPTLQDDLIERIDQQYGVFDGRTFREDRWQQWTCAQGIHWPRLASGRLSLSRSTFRDMALAHPRIHAMRELRATLSQMRLESLAVGPDGRNRVLLSAFRAKTGRNAPSTSKFIFGPATWLRHLIKPEPGHGIAYVDWAQQEFAIAASLSGDRAMQEAYRSGDPYLQFAIQAGAVPATATKATHGPQRDLFKACVLAVAYGMGHTALAYRISQSPAHARMLLELHHQTYPQFWKWSESAVDHALLFGELRTVFDWRFHVSGAVNARSLRNFPSQGNGAEMLRLACCLATEAGIEVVAPVHDAVLIHAPLDTLAEAVATTQQCMEQASTSILDGFTLQTDVEIFKYPNNYQDIRGKEMWKTIKEAISNISIINY